jgi:hypothetical protein
MNQFNGLINSLNSGNVINLNLTANSQASSIRCPVLEENFHMTSRLMECRMICNQRGKVDRMERSMNLGEENEL